jgi:hypothetical protein
MRISGTFLDEISHDIPSQNWGQNEWREDFRIMKAIGIDTVIMIRSGHRRWMTYPSAVLSSEMGGFLPPVDLVELFLCLSEEFGMTFYFGTYDSGDYWHRGEYDREIALSKRVVSEVWQRYGSSSAFGGFYLSCEVAEHHSGIVNLYADLGTHCKMLSGGLPVMISPYIAGKKATSGWGPSFKREKATTLSLHEASWHTILEGVQGSVDILAFQDGHVEFDELTDYLALNKRLADSYGMESWSNLESFDRDMPIKFLPIKWEKLLFKLKAAQEAGYEKIITFEFSHFMSPQSCYLQAHTLFDRYREYLNIDDPR